jgi:hypothetical protein
MLVCESLRSSGGNISWPRYVPARLPAAAVSAAAAAAAAAAGYATAVVVPSRLCMHAMRRRRDVCDRVNVGPAEPPVPFVYWATRMLVHDYRFARMISCALARGADAAEGAPLFSATLAAVRGVYGGVLRELLAAGAPAALPADDGTTPLHAAVKVGQFVAMITRRMFSAPRAELAAVMDSVLEFARAAPPPLARAAADAERALFAEVDALPAVRCCRAFACGSSSRRRLRCCCCGGARMRVIVWRAGPDSTSKHRAGCRECGCDGGVCAAAASSGGPARAGRASSH